MTLMVKTVVSETDEWERSTEAERKELLHRLWLAEARAMLAILENTAPSDLQAAQLAAARAFLSDNGVRSENLGNPPGTVDTLTEELAESVRALADVGEGSLPEADDHQQEQDWPERLEKHHEEGNL